MKKVITTSEKQTFTLAKNLAKTLTGGEVITLQGNLGAGKTVFTKGLAAGLGIKKIVNSPTFVLMNIYEVKHPMIKQLVHIDCYRLKNPKDIIDIGATEYFNQPDTVVVIEWAEKIKNILPRSRFNISINLKGETSRQISLG